MGQWPSYLVLILLVLLGGLTCSADCAGTWSGLNVGTVLFDSSTSCNHCWTKEELVLLSSRKAFQNLIPEVDVSRMQDERYIANLLLSIESGLERICSMSRGKSKHLLLRAYADAVGGYLYAFAVPLAKLAFYAGNVEQRNLRRLLELTAEIKDFLRTNSAGWARPLRLGMFLNVRPILVPEVADSSACDRLIVNSASEIPRRGRIKAGKAWRRTKAGRLIAKQCDRDGRNKAGCPFLYLPYFDNDRAPNSIALPFKDNNLWSLYDDKSVSILTTYYRTCVQCIRSMPDNKRILASFNRDFYGWLENSVYPRLSDDKWYPAFGGVLRIMVYLKGKKGVASTSKGYDFWGTVKLILVAVCTAAVVWLIVGMTLLCYKCRQKHLSEFSSCESSSTRYASYEDVDYCDINTCKERSSLCKKVRDWYRRKRKACSDSRCNIAEKEPCLASSSNKNKKINRTSSRKVYKKRKKSKKCGTLSTSSSSQYAYYENNQFRYSSEFPTSSDDSLCR